ncbi:MAG: hydrolase [Ruminococcaceae bacterium]|nr:hydrolase [Oscillospiraceae bacterium]
MTNKERFVKIYKDNIKREGSDKLLDHLCSSASDFFTAPASGRYHCAYPGGLCEHSLNVYDCLKAYLERQRVREVYGLDFTDETVAIVSLLHDLCKTNVYKPGFRNVKDENGVWQKVPSYDFEDKLPYGHGEKSVYIASGFMRLTRDEAFAIRYHMGFSGTEDPRTVGEALNLFPLAFALMTADMEATYFLESK